MKNLMLRRPRSGRLEARRNGDPASPFGLDPSAQLLQALPVVVDPFAARELVDADIDCGAQPFELHGLRLFLVFRGQHDGDRSTVFLDRDGRAARELKLLIPRDSWNALGCMGLNGRIRQAPCLRPHGRTWPDPRTMYL